MEKVDILCSPDIKLKRFSKSVFEHYQEYFEKSIQTVHQGLVPTRPITMLMLLCMVQVK